MYCVVYLYHMHGRCTIPWDVQDRALRTERTGTTHRATMESKFQFQHRQVPRLPSVFYLRPFCIASLRFRLAINGVKPERDQLPALSFCKSFLRVCRSISEHAHPRSHRFKKTQVKQIFIASLTSTLYVTPFDNNLSAEQEKQGK